MPDVIVFAGPSLPATPDDEWREVLSRVEVRPPAQRGDVLVATADHPRAIVIIDGFYYTVPAVTHKEIRYALDAGIRVIGSASMGALRAAEMAPLGMEGVGQVFEWYRDAVLDGDDEVAVLHAPRDFGYRAATVALVEVRAALARLVARGALAHPGARVIPDEDVAVAAIAAIKDMPFTERTGEAIRAALTERFGAAVSAALDAELAAHSIKSADALLALRRALDVSALDAMATGASANGTPLARPARRHPATTTNFLSHYREWYLRLPATEGTDPRRRTFMKAWYMVQVLHPRAPMLVRALRRRFLLASAATEGGLEPDAAALRRATDALTAHLERSPSGARLPKPELEDEAREHVLASLAVAHWGGARAALVALGLRHGIDAADAPSVLLRLASMQDDSVPPWVLARASVFSPTFEPAVAVAAAALEVFAAFREWSAPRRIAERDLRELAAQLWGCTPAAADGEARRRGLLRSHVTHGFVAGYQGAVELVAAAERLHDRVNDYPAERDLLRGAPVGHVLGLPGGRQTRTQKGAGHLAAATAR